MAGDTPIGAADEASGHVFVVRADLTRLACDGRLIPTDDAFRIESSFAGAVSPRQLDDARSTGWTGRRVIPLADAEGREQPMTFLAQIGRAGADVTWYTDVVDEFVASAKANLRVADRPLQLALPVVGTRAGGRHHEKGGILAALIRTLRDAARVEHVDLVLVTWDRGSYAAAQDARRAVLDRSSDGREQFWCFGPNQAPLEAAADQLARRRRDRELVLFIGAGVSAAAGMPTWQMLLDELAIQADPPIAPGRLHQLDLRDQAALIEGRLEPRDLGTHLRRRLSGTSYSLTHAQLATLDVHEHVTTNFDTLFEAARADLGDPLTVLPAPPEGADRAWLLKLHGSIDRDDVVLTRRQYLALSQNARALFGIVQALLMTRHMVFVGYSLSDDDFHQIVEEVRTARQSAGRFGTVLTLFADDLQEDLWGEDLDIVPMCAGPPSARSADLQLASRKLQIFLDLVAFESADHLSFLLDPTYAELLDDEELAREDALEQLARAVPLDGTSAAWTRIKSLLTDFGGGVGEPATTKRPAD